MLSSPIGGLGTVDRLLGGRALLRHAWGHCS